MNAKEQMKTQLRAQALQLAVDTFKSAHPQEKMTKSDVLTLAEEYFDFMKKDIPSDLTPVR